MNKQHGGKRAGAGRPKGSGKGRTVKTSSINLPPAVWEKLDAIRGDLSRSKWIDQVILNQFEKHWHAIDLKKRISTSLADLTKKEKILLSGFPELQQKAFALFKHLAKQTLTKSFFLSHQKLGDVLGITSQEAHRVFNQLIGVGVIRLKEKSSGFGAKANTYQWLLD